MVVATARCEISARVASAVATSAVPEIRQPFQPLHQSLPARSAVPGSVLRATNARRFVIGQFAGAACPRGVLVRLSFGTSRRLARVGAKAARGVPPYPAAGGPLRAVPPALGSAARDRDKVGGNAPDLAPACLPIVCKTTGG